jgi:hypothetical protein
VIEQLFNSLVAKSHSWSMQSDAGSSVADEAGVVLQTELTCFLQGPCVKSCPSIRYCLDDELHTLFLYHFLHHMDDQPQTSASGNSQTNERTISSAPQR